MNAMDRFFKLRENGADFRTEVVAGIRTFISIPIRCRRYGPVSRSLGEG